MSWLIIGFNSQGKWPSGTAHQPIVVVSVTTVMDKGALVHDGSHTQPCGKLMIGLPNKLHIRATLSPVHDLAECVVYVFEVLIAQPRHVLIGSYTIAGMTSSTMFL